MGIIFQLFLPCFSYSYGWIVEKFKDIALALQLRVRPQDLTPGKRVMYLRYFAFMSLKEGKNLLFQLKSCNLVAKSAGNYAWYWQVLACGSNN